ncbi:MAG: nickel insertion protein [Algisphaera sp.]
MAVPSCKNDVPTPTKVVELVVNLDDVTGEVIGDTVQQLLDAGALDVWTTAIQMKKQRPGVQLSVLSTEADALATAKRMLQLTGSFGVRHRPWDRLVLDRTHGTLETSFGPLSVKVGRLEGDIITTQPEFEPARAAAMQAGVPVRSVLAAVHAAQVKKDKEPKL